MTSGLAGVAKDERRLGPFTRVSLGGLVPLIFSPVVFGYTAGSLASDAATAPLGRVWQDLRASPGYAAAWMLVWVGAGMMLIGVPGVLLRLRQARWDEFMPHARTPGVAPALPPAAPKSFAVAATFAIVGSLVCWAHPYLPLRLLAIRPDVWWDWFRAPAVVATMPFAGGVVGLIVSLVLWSSIGHITAADVREVSGPPHADPDGSPTEQRDTARRDQPSADG